METSSVTLQTPLSTNSVKQIDGGTSLPRWVQLAYIPAFCATLRLHPGAFTKRTNQPLAPLGYLRVLSWILQVVYRQSNSTHLYPINPSDLIPTLFTLASRHPPLQFAQQTIPLYTEPQCQNPTRHHTPSRPGTNHQAVGRNPSK